jgi:hypothetical protein
MPEGISLAGQSPEVIAGTILVVAEVPNLYSSVLPSWFTISSPFFHEQGSHEGNVRRIRQGEMVATAEALAIGWGASVMFKSWLPFYGVVVMTAIQLIGYEYALNHPASEEGQDG